MQNNHLLMLMLPSQSNTQETTPAKAPSVVIDLKKNRLRVHRQTLQILGYPEYIQLLVNPTSGNMIIRSCSPKDSMAQHINWNNLKPRNSFEIYSKFFVNLLMESSSNWRKECLYYAQGTFYPDEKIVIFPLCNSTIIQNKEIPCQ